MNDQSSSPMSNKVELYSSDVGSEQLHLAVHAEDAVVLQVLEVGGNGSLYQRH